MPLYCDIRPQTLDDLVGNRSTVSAIRALFADGPEKAPRSFLLTGPSGTGKTTTARIIASMVGCHEIDLVELNSADARGIDTIRELIQQASIRPMMSRYRVFILDEAHGCTPQAQSALLKGLEDGPDHCFWILCTTDLGGIIKTIQNRCNIFTMAPLRPAEMKGLLVSAAEQLVDGGIEDHLINMIAEASGGSPRKALVLLEKVALVPSLKEAKELLACEPDSDGATPQMIDLLRSVAFGSSARNAVAMLWGLEEDAEKTRIALINYAGAKLGKEPECGEATWLAHMITRIGGGPLYGPTARAELAARLVMAYSTFSRDQYCSYEAKNFPL